MPSQENENAMDGLLRRSLARDSTSAGDCPDAELLAAYFDQSLGADEASRYEIHFSTCPRCREQLAAMARANTEQIEQSDLALEPALTGARPAQVITLDAGRIPAQAKPTVASAARSETKEPMRKSPDPRWLDLRWLVPVAAMLALGTFVFMRFASHQTSVGFNNQVAMTKSAPPPQEQTAAEPEKKASDVATQDKGELKKQPSPASSAQHPQSSAKPAANGALTSESPRMQRSEGTFSRSGTASRSAPTATPASLGAAGRASAFPSRKQTAGATSAAPALEDHNAASEPAPAAPAPELNASLPSIVVATSSADAVKSPAPAPPPTAEQKSQAFGLKSKNLHGSAAANSLAKAKPARESYSETIIPTPDSDIFYRIAGGGFVEISEDGGVTWQRQLLNPSAEFTAGSAPEPRICWLAGRSGIVFLTEDGKNWQKLSSPTSDDLVAVIAKSASAATVTANDNRKWSTDDAGKNWHPVK
jgi:hypothetical protein